MLKVFNTVVVLFTFVTISACTMETEGSTVSNSRLERLKADLSVFQSDPEILDFLAQEAVRANVRSIQPVPTGGIPLNGRKVFIQYGLTTSDRIIYLNQNSAGGRSVVNITHEIAHVAKFGGNCGGHNRRWLEAYLGIAERYEERFPGVTWSGTTPSNRVMRNESRYDIGGRC